jgi:hypothetical protein
VGDTATGEGCQSCPRQPWDFQGTCRPEEAFTRAKRTMTFEGQLGVVNAQAVQDGRLQVVDRH